MIVSRGLGRDHGARSLIPTGGLGRTNIVEVVVEAARGRTVRRRTAIHPLVRARRDDEDLMPIFAVMAEVLFDVFE